MILDRNPQAVKLFLNRVYNRISGQRSAADNNRLGFLSSGLIAAADFCF